MEQDNVKFDIKDIQYVNMHDYPTNLDKASVYTYYIMMHKPSEEWQRFKRRIDTTKLTLDDIVRGINDKLKSITSPSQIAKYYAWLNKVFTSDEYKNCAISKEINNPLPNFTYTSHRIAGENDEKLLNIVEWRLNKVAPQLTGFFIEVMWANAIGKRDGTSLEKLVNSEKILRMPDVKTTNDDLDKFFEMNGMYDLASKNKFVEYLIRAACARCVKSDFCRSHHDDVINMLELITNKDFALYLDEYFDALCKSTLARIMKNEPNLQHSVIVSDGKQFAGEVDFLSDSAITDAKCYKTDEHILWFAQLWVYRKCCKNNQALKLRIIDFDKGMYHEYDVKDTPKQITPSNDVPADNELILDYA